MKIITVPFREGGRRVPLLAASTMAGTARGGLRKEASEITAGARAIAGLGAGLGVGDLDAREEERVVVQIDPRAALIARALVPALREAPKVAAAAGVTAEAQDALLGKFRGMATLHLCALQLDGDLRDSRTVTGEVLRRLRREIGEGAERLLNQGDLDEGLEKRLRAALLPIKEAEHRLRTARATLSEKTAAAGRAMDSAVAEEERHGELLQTMLEMRRGGAVSQEAAAEAAAAYEELAEADDRRGNDR